MRDRNRREVLLVVQTAAAMFAVAAAFGYVRLRQMGHVGTEPTIVVLSLPVSATLLYVLMTFLVPSLLAPGRLAFPLNLTLPIVFAALTVASVVLWTTTGSAAFQVPDVLQVAHLWKQPATLIIVGVGQAITLTALGFLSRPKTSE